jgi:hypothetical protein
MLIKGHQRIDAELKHRRKLFFSTGGALVRIHCITIDHVAHKIMNCPGIAGGYLV